MGYNTTYELEADPWPDGLSEILKEDDNFSYALDPDGSSCQSCKWYEHTEDMIVLSRKFPGSVFTLRGEGEEHGDIWAEYYRDGKYHREKAKIVIGRFDPAKLH